MTNQITLEEALELVDFYKNADGNWQVHTVKGDCRTVKGNCGIVKGNCNLLEGNCGIVKGNSITVGGNCNLVRGDCGTVEGEVLYTIAGRQWQYTETPKQRLERLIKDGATKEQLLEAVGQLDDNAPQQDWTWDY